MTATPTGDLNDADRSEADPADRDPAETDLTTHDLPEAGPGADHADPDPLARWTKGAHTAPVRGRPTTHPIYRRGTGPGVIVIHEFPGLNDLVVAYADEVAEAGFTVVMPHLFGPLGRPRQRKEFPGLVRRICVRREFNVLGTGATSPVASWLRSLARELHEELGGPGVGALGMCFSGGFALAMMVEETTVAPVLAQPSLPLPIGARRAADLGLSPEDAAAVQQRAANGCPVLGLRYASDGMVGTRFDTLEALIGDAFRRIDLPGEGHATLTRERSQDAVDATLEFFAERLRRA